MGLASPFYNKNYHVHFDNFFASPKLMEDLKERICLLNCAH